ncbi:bifunctional diaminohydroxyphosphoribosylaminopyrimidine deaminase/5-amino-6-(5-phosphoribosylamino)uracil reductase RibD [Sinomonas halotolerans]|uniref:bifunctional diaminohydroxyphosphoribosylaminopyrimidine deaminase/5-amino-6-(5-phosphoribosylamino)uracil reductase RibD n=1 Tax=Sinomonas halotolerans TaxID=1644133 RepID=UPI003D06E62F
MTEVLAAPAETVRADSVHAEPPTAGGPTTAAALGVVRYTAPEAMRRALALAATPGVPLGPNPRVGCVILADDGGLVAEGFHRGAGTAHAEVDALARAGDAARGMTAFVTLEPCNHTGRAGPCAQALIAAEVRRVVYALADPNPLARGGAETLREAGIEVEGGLLEAEARELNAGWLAGIRGTAAVAPQPA